MINEDGSRKSAKAWDGAGGWISKFFARPDWQDGLGLPPRTGKGAVTNRLTSDICSVASLNPGIAYISGEEGAAGGTSFAAPRLAGVLGGLLFEAMGGKRIGNLLPILYKILNSDQYKLVFFDVTEGEATGGRKGPGLPATEGWDHPTGMGAPNDAALIDLLVKLHNGTAKLTFNGQRARKRRAAAAKAEQARTRRAANRKAA
jgi:subtilase family serine protease